MGPTTKPATRRRGEVLETALLDAAWEVLRADGYAGFTMEAVAERAGTSRPVLYRRWPSRADLVIAALRSHRPMLSGGVPDTGSLRSDVLAVLDRMSQALVAIGPETVYGLIGDYLADSDLFARLQGRVLHVSAEVMETILERAAARGEARPDVPTRVATVPTDLFRNELFRHRRPPSDEALAEIVDDVFLPLVQPA